MTLSDIRSQPDTAIRITKVIIMVVDFDKIYPPRDVYIMVENGIN